MIRAALVLCVLATPALAAPDCPQNRAIYSEKDNGYILSFRPTEPWEASANTMTILTLDFPEVEGTEKESVWGWIWLPNGTSHDRIELFHGCSLPTLDAGGDEIGGSTHDELDACSVWEGIIVSLADDDIHEIRWHDGAMAAETLLLPNLGPTIRYSGLVLSPGDEPHDVFTFTRCSPE